MVGRKKASASTTKPAKQKTLLDLFPKKIVSAAAPQPIIPPLPQPTPPTIDLNDGQRSYGTPTPPGPIASTSKAVQIIDITGPEPSKPRSKPPSKRTELDKPNSLGSTKPPSSKAESRPPDPIVIDLTSHESPPPNTIPTPTPKSTYHIFAPRATIDPPSSKAPPSASVLLKTARPTYSIFNARPKKLVDPKTKPSVATTESEAPFPTKDGQHVRGPQSSFSASTYWQHASQRGIRAPLKDYRPRMGVSDVHAARTLTRTSASSFWEKEQCIERIPSEHKRDHPAIARLGASISNPPDASSSSEKLWTERWRPQRADGVLGNEERAVYLRDWLRALEVRFETTAASDNGKGKGKASEESRGAKRPQVMRSVTRAKKRRRQSSDGFLVSDDYYSDVEGPFDTDGDDDDDFRAPPGTEDPQAAQNEFKDHLANTIILSGPPGIGKTTAVYSCAEELGWEVFEVNPGIGKRNGASLETLIGDVGKNHLVRRTQARGVFSRGRDEDVDTDNSDDFGFVTQKQRKAGGTRQSVILLEEVDILFKEDASFWPAVVRLIRDCKRPVICTCNDISLVPTSELPLQTILEFEPCPPDVAGSYLQGLCCAEGHIVDRDVLAKMYARGCDLRHIIHRLQLLCQSFPLGFHPEQDHLLDWNAVSRQSVPHADLISFTDAYLTRDSLDRPQALALTRYDRGADDELGFPILADALTDGYGVYEWDTKIISAVNELSRGKRVARATEARVHYQSMIDALRNNPAFPVGIMERAVAHTEYVPWARHIIVGEDALEARQGRCGRATRNSTRYIRSIELGKEERDALDASRIE
ncbi:hypothetical protein DFH07DRAFT_914076 [Mycena maculata]|uniref:AAA+ ATPase domain-containing protein n=1 Tax=Mycena maculata TaxID=230809 RepID=A0AAD7JT57_9AGAR|nr:hypothetical protein DFH07DRAFT_914076 [Mycena maculata]